MDNKYNCDAIGRHSRGASSLGRRTCGGGSRWSLAVSCTLLAVAAAGLATGSAPPGPGQAAVPNPESYPPVGGIWAADLEVGGGDQRVTVHSGDGSDSAYLEIASGSPAFGDGSIWRVLGMTAAAQAGEPFVTIWEATDSNRTVRIPVGGATGNYTVDWGDGETTSHATDATHTYDTAGNYTVSISGDFTKIYLNGDPADRQAHDNAQRLRYIQQWGDMKWSSMASAFEGASNLIYNATDAPDLSGATSTAKMFRLASQFDGDISGWDVSSVTDMRAMFQNASAFDQNLGRWYVVPNGTSIIRSDIPGVVGSISAQNAFLDDHESDYGIGAGADSGFFEMAGGNLLNMTSADSGRTSYQVNVTASGGSVFENGNNWRLLDIAVTNIQDDTPPTVESIEGLRPGTNEALPPSTNLDIITLQVTFSEVINRDTFDAGDLLDSSNGTVTIGSIAPESNQTAYNVTIANLAGLNDGEFLTIDIWPSGDPIQDLAGNNYTGYSRYGIQIDRTGPAPTLTHTGNPTPDVIGFEVDFGEAVDRDEFTADDITSSNGSVSGDIVSHDNRTFSFGIEHGLSGGSLTVSVRANATTDVAGNYNGASGPFTIEVYRGPSIRELSTVPLLASKQVVKTEANATVVEVDAVPIVVNSTVADYFVLYVRHVLDGNGAVEIPVSVTLGENGTTTLSENVEALPAERYRVERYLVSDPADVDGDGIDDIAELADPVGMNPVNPAAAINLTDGAVAVPDRGTFEALAYYESYLKFVLIDLDTSFPSVYFVNTTTHDHHSHFLRAIGVQRNQETIVGSLFYVPELDAPDGSRGLYSYRLPTSYFPISLVERSYTVLAASMPLLSDNLAFNLRNTILSSFRADLPLYSESRVNLVFDIEIYADTGFLALNTGEGYGLLRVMEPDELPRPRDVVIYEALPNELPRVAGIISTVPQTPLSHVNLRALQDRVPNAYIRDALDEHAIESLLGHHVHYTVTEDGWDVRATTRAEVDAHYNSSRPAEGQTPQRDLSVASITALGDIGFANSTAFGVKAANVAELGKLGFPNGTVPDGFAVPFYFYDEFMKHNDLYSRIETMLADPDFQANFTVQESELKKLRKAIRDAETPAWIAANLTEMHGEFANGTSLRYRSSTNNEDLPGFNGAGLYDSKTQHPEETEEDGISKSLKQVYASLWNFRAFVERDFYRINHTAAAMGVLVHPNYSDELANGVAVSFDSFSYTASGYYVNTQLGEDLVTNPEAHSVPEEILLNQDGTYIILGTSNLVPRGQLLMSDDQVSQLGRHLTVIHDEFKKLYNPGPDEPFAMEIEFKITSEDVLAIKQARPWVFNSGPVQKMDGAPPTFRSATYSKGTGILAIAFSEEISGTADLLRLHVRESGHSFGGTVLTGAAQAIAGNTLTITLTGPQKTAVNSLTMPELDIDAGAVSDGTNGILAAPDRPIAVVDNTPITVVNHAPSADAGSDQTVTEGDTVRLHGSGSDRDGDFLTYYWEQTGGPPVLLSSGTVPSPTFTAPQVTSQTDLVFRLAVRDSVSNGIDTVRITVQNEAEEGSSDDGSSNGGGGSENNRDSQSSRGGGGGGGGAPEEIITDVRIYSVTWDCAARTVSATVGPDSGQLSVRMRTSSVGERPVSEVASTLLGSRTYTATMSGADQFVVIEANLAYEGDQIITKIVNFRECAGHVIIDRYEPPGREPAGTAPGRPETNLGQQQEICRDGRQSAVRDGSRLLCLFPGTFETLSGRGWELARP